MSIGRIEEYLERKRWEYLTASKKQKGRILDEVCGALHYHRKAAVRTLKPSPGWRRGTQSSAASTWARTSCRARFPPWLKSSSRSDRRCSPAPCTGYRAAFAIYQALPNAFVQNTVGTRIVVEGTDG